MTDLTDKDNLITRLNSETAKISWYQLQTHYAAGSVLCVSANADLIKVAIALTEDNTQQIKQWLEDGRVLAVTDQQAIAWHANNRTLWALVIPPFVLVQEPKV
tara:strand:+ start:1176 stop:1484 length:309 start_codon:yes stop_codon:yes gene_type:complete